MREGLATKSEQAINELLLPEAVPPHLEGQWKRKKEGQCGYKSEIINPEASINFVWFQMSPKARNIRELNVQQWTGPE